MIYCEGETEKRYFEMLTNKYRRITINTKRISVKTKVMGKKSPIHIVQEAIKTYQHDQSKFQIHKCYVVFDNDLADISEIQKAIKLARENNIEIIYSNISFDIWVLLHYKEVNKYLSKENLYEELKKEMRVKSYEDLKGTDLSSYIEDRIQLAYNNACKNENMNETLQRSISTNPYTNVHHYIKEIFQVNKL